MQSLWLSSLVRPRLCHVQIIASAAAVMESTIDHVEKQYGSAHNYCKHVGLSETEIGSIVRNLTGPEPLNTNAASEKL
jgi:hypothetical protein